jgi:integrase
MNNLAEPGLRLDGKETALSDHAIMYCYRVLSSMLNDAVEWQIIIANPCDRVKPPAIKKKKAKAFTEEQAGAVIDAVLTEELKYQVLVILAISTGLRLGELTGLEWKDINFIAKQLTVARSSQSIAGLGTFTKTPKNDSSCRTIEIGPNIIELLKEYKAQQNETRLQLGDTWHDYDRLFTQWDGRPIYTQTPSQWFGKFLKRHKLPHVSFHGLRHTAASHLIAQGVPLKYVSSMLGHADIRTTGNLYGHTWKSINQQMALHMDSFITRKKK